LSFSRGALLAPPQKAVLQLARSAGDWPMSDPGSFRIHSSH
jgi:hypothetical protein